MANAEILFLHHPRNKKNPDAWEEVQRAMQKARDSFGITSPMPPPTPLR